MLHTATPACNIKTIIQRQWMNPQAKPFTQKEHTMKLYDALDTMRIFCQALDGHTPEINIESWDNYNLITCHMDYQGLYLNLSMYKTGEPGLLEAWLVDMKDDRTRVRIKARAEFVLDVVKQAAVRYPASEAVA